MDVRKAAALSDQRMNTGLVVTVKKATTGGNPVVRDKVDINGNVPVNEKKISREKSAGGVYKSLAEPKPETRRARNEAPVVVVHGTLADKSSIKEYLEAALESGHPVDLSTYLSVKEGRELQESGQIISQNVNEGRVKLAKENLDELNAIRNKPDKLKKYFLMDSNLYGVKDKSVDEVVSLIPGVVDKMNGIMKLSEEELGGSFSTRTKQVEKELAQQVRKAGFGEGRMNAKKRNEVCDKIAGEIMDTIAPKTILLGHSMGGFVSNIIALNPKDGVSDKDPFKYDAGNGISTVMTLSSPIKKGTNSPLPDAWADMAYNLTDRYCFKPMEANPGMQLARMNPFFNAWYVAAKEMTKTTYRYNTEVTASMTNPWVHMQKPGFKQIEEGSEFNRKYLYGKEIPEGVSIIAVSNREDGVSEQDRSMANDTKPNAHNLDAEVKIKPEDFTKWISQRSTLAHLKMSQYPKQHWKEFKEELAENPKQLPRLLDRSNYDGIRWNVLQTVLDNVKEDRGFLKQPGFEKAFDAVVDVAGEMAPFKDSPAYVAKQVLLETLGRPSDPDADVDQGDDKWIMIGKNAKGI